MDNAGKGPFWRNLGLIRLRQVVLPSVSDPSPGIWLQKRWWDITNAHPSLKSWNTLAKTCSKNPRLVWTIQAPHLLLIPSRAAVLQRANKTSLGEGCGCAPTLVDDTNLSPCATS